MPCLTGPHSGEPLAVVPCSGDASHPVELFLTRVNLNNHSVLKSAQCHPHFSQSTSVILNDTPYVVSLYSSVETPLHLFVHHRSSVTSPGDGPHPRPLSVPVPSLVPGAQKHPGRDVSEGPFPCSQVSALGPH